MGGEGPVVGAWMPKCKAVTCCVQLVCVRVTWACVTVCAGVSLVGVCVSLTVLTRII